ncbi:MAG: 16S rRNA (cytosine(967)-C(5))-methyltransferase RsmB, partial [Gammaproteobacteria bacterium]|nr:16S rRNA (cytosine(967)-C(5))-methyltransferase RsmB [Gammaproteobacteria bacterium]
REDLLQQVAQAHSSHYAHPQWIISALKKSWPQHWSAILEANNVYPPFTLRCNARQVQRDDYLQQLEEVELSATTTAHTEQGITLEQACPVERLPGFDQGRASVQDGAAQLAAQLLDAQAGERVLDACAAPGGKLAHILERQPDCQVIAVDIDAHRVERIEQNLNRLQLSAKVVTADVAATEQWWDGEAFDRILLDAPCSATGVIRRHPDIKQLRRAEDIAQLADLQAKILDALWATLKSGGQMVYATCSIMAEENHLQMSQFLLRHKDARELPLEVTWGHACEVGRQILPGEDGMDGFYYAILHKT